MFSAFDGFKTFKVSFDETQTERSLYSLKASWIYARSLFLDPHLTQEGFFVLHSTKRSLNADLSVIVMVVSPSFS